MSSREVSEHGPQPGKRLKNNVTKECQKGIDLHAPGRYFAAREWKAEYPTAKRSAAVQGGGWVLS